MKSSDYLNQAVANLTQILPHQPLIFVAVPHQMKPEDMGFFSREEFDRWLWCFQPHGYDLRTFVLEDWADRREEREEEGWGEAENESIHQEGLRLFAAGARTVAEACASECSDFELLPDVDCTAHLLRSYARPYHAVYVLSREDTRRLLTRDSAAPRLSHHQFYEVRELVAFWADQLGWKEAGA
jgi:hypothetical protein